MSEKKQQGYAGKIKRSGLRGKPQPVAVVMQLKNGCNRFWVIACIKNYE